MAKKVTSNKSAKKNGATAKESKAKKPSVVTIKKKAAPIPAAPARKAKPMAKAPVKKAPAPKPAPKKAAPVKAAPKSAPAKKAATPAKVAAKPAVKKAVPQKTIPKKAAPQKAVAPKAAPQKVVAPKKAAPPKAAQKKPVAQKAAAAAKPVAQKTPTLGDVQARKLAIQKIQAKRNLGKPAPKPEPDSTQPSGMYNGIVITHEVKPFPAKTPYTKPELDELRETMLEERNRLLNQLASLQGVGMEAMVNAKEHSGYSIHIAEHASDLQAAEANMGVRSIEEDRLEEVESALDRIENNPRHYGLCMACGNKIGIQRLKARPHAHLCMPCRTRYETIRSRRGY